MAVSSFQWLFLAPNFGRFYLVFLSVQKEKTSLSEQSSHVFWKFTGVPASSIKRRSCSQDRTSNLTAFTCHRLLLAQHYSHRDRAWCGINAVLISSLASKLALMDRAQCAMGYLATFQFSEQATMLQRALALSVMKEVGHFIPCPVLLCYLLCFLCSPGGWVIRKGPSRKL